MLNKRSILYEDAKVDISTHVEKYLLHVCAIFY